MKLINFKNQYLDNNKKLNFGLDGRNHYVYRITNLITCKHYYGSRVTKLDPRKDIGIKYFSSSSDKEFLVEQKHNPDNFKYKVIKVFDNPADCIIYESYLHQKFKVGTNDKFINRAIQTPCGFSISCNKQSAIKTKQKMSQIDPETGLTGYQKAGLKSKQSNLKIDPETGLTGYQKAGLKSKQSNLKIDPETGLTGYQKAGLKSKQKMSQIDPETGLTGYQKSGLKSKEILSQIDPETGLTGYQTSGLKTKKIMSQVDPETGLTGYQKVGHKVSNTLMSVQESGLTRAEEIGIKTKNTLLKINNKTGLTRAEEIGIKTKNTLQSVQESGLTRAEEIGIKNSGENHYSFNGFYVYKGIKYVNPRDIVDITGVSVKTIRTWCKNSSKVITKNNVYRCKFLTKYDTGQTFRDIGFDYYIIDIIV